MTKCLFTRALGDKLVPADEDAKAFVQSLRPGRGAWVEVRKARNPRRHRLFWALVGICMSNTNLKLSKEAWADYLKILGGHVEVVRRKNGEVLQLPKSIAWSRLSEGEFVEFINRLMDAIRTEIIPGLPEADLRRELEEITGITEDHTHG